MTVTINFFSKYLIDNWSFRLSSCSSPWLLYHHFSWRYVILTQPWNVLTFETHSDTSISWTSRWIVIYFIKYLVDNWSFDYHPAAGHTPLSIEGVLFAWVWFSFCFWCAKIQIGPQGGMFRWIISWHFDPTLEYFRTYRNTSIWFIST